MTMRLVGVKEARERPVHSAGIYKTIQRFNRNTTWVAMGLLAPVVFAALMVALQDRYQKVDNRTEEPRQTSGDMLPNTNPTALSYVASSSEQDIGEIASRQPPNVDSGLTPSISPLAVDLNATPPSPAPQPGPARVVRSNISNVRDRTHTQPRVVNVKMRLIDLWHQSLARIFKKSHREPTFAMSR
jgi:hypothetical protein